jgi:hypothetical protein
VNRLDYYKSSKDDQEQIFVGPGVWISKDSGYATPILGAALGDNARLLLAVPYDKPRIAHLTADAVVDEKTGFVTFSSSNFGGGILRDFREEDGLWLSRYRVMVPTRALQEMVISTDLEEDTQEILYAVVRPTSQIAIALVYNFGSINWTRIDGDWTFSPDAELKFSEDERVEIPRKEAKEFIANFDSNYVTYEDVMKFAD